MFVSFTVWSCFFLLIQIWFSRKHPTKWRIKTADWNGWSEWLIKTVDHNGRLKRSIEMADQNGWPKWFDHNGWLKRLIEMADQNGWSKRLIKMAHSNGWSKWLIKMADIKVVDHNEWLIETADRNGRLKTADWNDWLKRVISLVDHNNGWLKRLTKHVFDWDDRWKGPIEGNI